MALVAEDGRMVLVNAQTEKLFGYARAELLGHTPCRIVAKADAQRVLHLFDRSREAARPAARAGLNPAGPQAG